MNTAEQPLYDWLTDALDEWPTSKWERVEPDSRLPRVYEAAPKWPVRERLGSLSDE